MRITATVCFGETILHVRVGSDIPMMNPELRGDAPFHPSPIDNWNDCTSKKGILVFFLFLLVTCMRLARSFTTSLRVHKQPLFEPFIRELNKTQEKDLRRLLRKGDPIYNGRNKLYSESVLRVRQGLQP